MEWTRKRPKEPGAYWHLYAEQRPHMWILVYNKDGSLCHLRHDNRMTPLRHLGGLWYGPLEPPSLSNKDV